MAQPPKPPTTLKPPTMPNNTKEKRLNHRPVVIFILLTIILILELVSAFEYIVLLWLFLVLPKCDFKFKFNKK